MGDALIVPVLVTTDLLPGTDLAAFGQLVADAVGTLQCEGGGWYPGDLGGATFWLDRPVPPQAPGHLAPEQLRCAAMLGLLSTRGPRGSAKDVLADVRAAIVAAVVGQYGDLGSPPAVLGITNADIRERTPETAIIAATRHPSSELAAATRLYL
ncbi:hypothetical protein DQ384_39970 [Sphaerisporangium album]|uniref:Uncharacterized protein n=1 Tax=Sphaerisporangium album TaxID=509200 RepID=A0A367EGT5_9ACTN|nr:hypothetical protein [Sphaerisporangium album]RCG16922.1 hypothetical protein DQ384_39970 [Sphaerisporangium album]